MSEIPGPSPEELGIESTIESEINPDQEDIMTSIGDVEIEDPGSGLIRPLEPDEVALAEIGGLIPPSSEMFPTDRTEARPGMDLERARAIDRFFLNEVTLLEATNIGQNAVLLGMICLNKESSKELKFGRLVEINNQPDPAFPDHPKPMFVLEYLNGERENVNNVKPSYDLNAKELGKLPPEYGTEMAATYETSVIKVGSYVKLKDFEHVGRVAHHLDQEVFPGQIGLLLRDADSRAHLVATALENIEPRS